MIQLQDFIEGSFSNLSDTLIVTPSAEHLFYCSSFLCFFHALKKNNCCAKELIFSLPIKVNILKFSRKIFTLLDQFFELIVVTFQTLDILSESLLCLIYSDFLVVNEFPLLIFENDTSLPPLEISSFADTISLCNSCIGKFTESPDPRL